MSLTGTKYDDYEARFLKRIAQLTPMAKKLNRLDLHNLGMNWGYGGDMYQEELRPFLHVEEINLRGNYIDGLVINLARFTRLKHLDLSSNAYWYWGAYGQLDFAAELPCPNLETLNLSYNQIGVILFKNSAFKDTLLSLNLSFNHFASPRNEREHPVLRLDRFSRLRELNLSDCSFPHVPNLSYLPNLEALDLSLNPIRSGHDDLLALPKLKRLNLRCTGMRRVPKPLLNMKQLEHLDLRFNHMPFAEITCLQRALPDTKIEHDIPQPHSQRIP